MYTAKEHQRSVHELGLALAASVLLHLVGFFFFVRIPPSFPSDPFVVDVVLAPPREELASVSVPSQIVSEPDRSETNEETPREARFRAERDSVTEVEQVRRGTDPRADSVVSPVRKNPGKAKEEQPDSRDRVVPSQHSSSPARVIPRLKLDERVLLSEFGERELAEKQEERGEQPSRNPLAGYQAFSRPLGSGAAFLGTRGVTDYLPNLPDGDITLLNAKADRFAVFVRRVATQVFGQLRASGWEQLRAGDVNGIREFSEVRAILSVTGELLRVEITGRSGSRRFDEVLQLSVTQGVRDPNPPPGAVAADGLIHFIFRSRSWVDFSGSARNGAPVERRWLLLATGLE